MQRFEPQEIPAPPLTTFAEVDFTTLTTPGITYKIIPPGCTEQELKEGKIDKPLRLFTFGCADGGVAAMRQVVELMADLAAGKEYDIILILGDNFDSKDPALHQAHNAFLTHLHNIFSLHPLLKKIPKFVILGNHDAMDKNGLNREMMKAQIRHTYTKLEQDDKGMLNYVKIASGEAELDLEKIRLFMPQPGKQEIVIPYEKLLTFTNQWHMPSLHYSFMWGDTTEVICSNTNTLVSEYLTYIDCDTPKDPLNQMHFLLNRINKTTVSTLLFAGHHPIVNANDKRTISSDHGDYTTLREYDLLVKFRLAEVNSEDGTHTSNHTDILFNIIFHPGNASLGLPVGPGHKITAFLVAHHHAMDFYNDGLYIQIKSGGAGGPPPLQNRFSYKNPHFLPAFLKNNGVVSITISAGPHPTIIINFHGLADPAIQLNAVPNPHIQFSLVREHKTAVKSFFHEQMPAFPADPVGLIDSYITHRCPTEPMRQPRKKNMETLSQVIIAACKEYQSYLSHNPPPYPWQAPDWRIIPQVIRKKVLDRRGDDVIFVDALLNYFNSYEAIDFNESVNFLRMVLIKLSVETLLKDYYYRRWFEIFDAALKQTYGISYAAFIANPALLQEGIVETPASELALPALKLENLEESKNSYAPEPSHWPVSSLHKTSFQFSTGMLSRLFSSKAGPATTTQPDAKTSIPFHNATQLPSSTSSALLFNVKGIDCSPARTLELGGTFPRSLPRAIPQKDKSPSRPSLSIESAPSSPELGQDPTTKTPGSFTCTLFSPLDNEMNTEFQDHYIAGGTPGTPSTSPRLTITLT